MLKRIRATFSNIVETLVQIPFVKTSKSGLFLLGQRFFFHKFLRIPQSTFPIVHFPVKGESGRSCAQTIPSDFF